MSIAIIYVTHESNEAAMNFADELLKKHLVACSNYFPITCAFWWDGRIEDGHEVVTMLKTRVDLWDKVKTEIEKIHPYDTPCILKFEVEANEVYEKWVADETKKAK